MKVVRVMLVMVGMGVYGVVLGVVMVGVIALIGAAICFVVHLLGL